MISVVVPAYNEAQTIGQVVEGLKRAGYDHVVVVDDGSRDATAQLAKAAGATVLRHQVNRGQGAALQTGNDYAYQAGADYVVHFDGDGQFNPADIAGALARMKKEGLDVIVGTRFLDTRSSVPWLKKYFIFPLARRINQLFTGLRLSDVHNGFRILSRRALDTIRISHDGMAHNTEIMQLINRHKLPFAEHPVQVVYYEMGQGIKGGMVILKDLVVRSIISKK